MRKAFALRHHCPMCGAVPGVACTGKKGLRKSSHNERHGIFRERSTTPPVPPRQKKLSERKGFYFSREWREVRYQALKLHGGACQCCGARGSKTSPLHVDHIRPRSKFPEIELDVSNLQVLCEDCNLGKSNCDHTDWRPQATRPQ